MFQCGAECIASNARSVHLTGFSWVDNDTQNVESTLTTCSIKRAGVVVVARRRKAKPDKPRKDKPS